MIRFIPLPVRGTDSREEGWAVRRPIMRPHNGPGEGDGSLLLAGSSGNADMMGSPACWGQC